MTNVKESKIENNDELVKKFTAILNQYNLDTQAQWNIFTSFFVVHALIAGFLVNFASKTTPNIWIIVPFSIFGLLLSIFWFMGYLRASETCMFRLKQAQESEPNNWYIFGGKAKDYFEGSEINIGDEPMKMPFNKWKNRFNRYAIILIFTLFYIITPVIVVVQK